MREGSGAGVLARGRAPILCLAAAVLLSGALILGLDRNLTFIADDWALLVERQGLGAGYFLEPFHEHVLIGPAFAYELLLAVFGMGSATPFFAVAIATFLFSAVLLFVYARRRVGDWMALIAAVFVLFLGAAFEDLLFAFQIGFFASVAAGLGMLIALDREDDRGDRIAVALLVVSMLFSSVGFAFLAGAAADVLLGRRPWVRRAYVALLPLGLYGFWWLGWGHTAESNVSVDNLVHLPGFVFDSVAAGFTSLMGLATGDGSEPDQPHLIWGRLVAIAAAALLALRLYRDRRLSRGLGVTLAVGFAFWVLAGLDRDEARFPTSSRYQYPSAVFLLLILAETLRGRRIPRPAIAATAVVAVLAAMGGYSLMHREYEERWRPVSDALRTTLGAVDIAGENADPEFPIAFAPTLEIGAGKYLSVANDHGSAGFDEAELEARPAPDRGGADLTMAQALGLALVPPDGARTLGCQTLQASAEGETGITLLRGRFTLANRGSGDVEVWLRRFADEFSVNFGPFGAGGRTSLTIPTDNSARPWVLGLKGAGPVRLCTTEPA